MTTEIEDIIEVPNHIKITADSTCDLSRKLLEKYDISVSPLYINMDGKTYKDAIEIFPNDIYAYVDKTGVLPKTSAVTYQDYIDLFTPYVLAGRTVIHFTISNEMSSCYQNAVNAAKELGNIYVVDSLNLSTAIGHLAVKAAELATQGLDAEEIVSRLDVLIPKLETSFIIDTLKYLHKGGRCSSVAALGANLLSLKPCIEVKNGKMGVGKKYRGNLEKCLINYITDRLKDRTDINYQRLFITHSSMPQHLIDTVVKTVGKLAPFHEIYITDTNCTVANHCGPGTLGIIFYRK